MTTGITTGRRFVREYTEPANALRMCSFAAISRLSMSS